jgi:hypothetical protein
MPETSVPTPPGFDTLSKAEQVRYLQALWDQIAEDPGTLPGPGESSSISRRAPHNATAKIPYAHTPLSRYFDRLADTFQCKLRVRVSRYRLLSDAAADADIEAAFEWYESDNNRIGV